MEIKFFESKDPEELESMISNWSHKWRHEIMSISLTTRKIGYTDYIVACVLYE